MDELDDFLGTETPEPQTEQLEAPQPETIGQPRDESGRFAPKETGVETPQPEQGAEPVPPTDKLPPETYKALREEREKRQRLEQELETLKQERIAPQQPQEPPAPPPSLWEDEQAWQQHFGSQVAQQAAFNAKLDMSEMLARQSNEDFDAMKVKFLEMAQANPGLAQQALADAHPWAKAYTIAKNAAKMEELGAVDVTTLEARIREQVMTEMQAQQTTAPTPSLPNSLADAQSARASAASAQSGPPSLADIIGR